MKLCGNMLIAHGGGPTPVINASLQGAIEQAKKHSEIETIYGARFGAEGILSKELIDLGAISDDKISMLSQTPASALGSCRKKLTQDDFDQIMQCFKRFNIRYFFYNGGNDSMDTCEKIHRFASESGYDLRVIGIPKTIDNDLEHTDHSPGYASAARFVANTALEISMDAAALPIHVVVLEVMGRNAGWLTAASTLYKDKMPSDHIVYMPEMPFDSEQFIKTVVERFDKRRGLLVTVSEGIRDASGKMIGDTGIQDGFGHVIPGGAAHQLAQLIIQKTGLGARSEKPGLLGRVSMTHVSSIDSSEAYSAGSCAVKSAVLGKSGFMVSIAASRETEYSSEMELVPLSCVANKEKKFPKEWIVGTDIDKPFKEYCTPLLGDCSPNFVIL